MGLSLLAILVIAKLALAWGHAAPITAVSLSAYLWQDAAIALSFAACEIALRRIGASPRVARAVYWTLATYIAINIPVERAVSTPLTLPMLIAARGPLADSLLVYLTATNILLVASALTIAAGMPLLLRRAPPQFARCALLCTIPLVLPGPAASRRIDTHGMDRNALTALIRTELPRVSAHTPSIDWRASRFPADPAEDLSQFAGAARGLNIVMVSLESTAAQYLSLYGGQYDVTPNLSALARNALVFDNAYAVYPESIKGLYSVLCSAYPAFDSHAESYGNVACQSLAQVLADAGYRTALFHSGRFGYLGMESIIRHRGFETLQDAGDIGGNHNSSFGVDEPATVARILKWIDALPQGQHFFLAYLPIAGHHPYAAPGPGPFSAATEIGQYRNALHYGDASLGALMQGLRERGLDGNTVWVVYGDHGEAFGQHPGNYGHTFFVYEENVHVPFLIAAPRFIYHQQHVGKAVSLVDTAPTILSLLGISPPGNYQGSTMLDPAPRMALFFADYSLGILGLRDGRWKFEYEIESGRSKLFDLDRDARETTNLAQRETPRAQWYRQELIGWCHAQKLR